MGTTSFIPAQTILGNASANGAAPSALTQAQMQSVLAPPPPAAAVGYTTRTFGPNVTLGVNWFLFNLLGVTPIAGQATQNADGSVSMGQIADASGFGACICSAQKILSGTSWAGFAVGGGHYIEWDLAFIPTLNPPGGVEPFPAGWSDEITYLAQIGGANQWVGQAAGYQNRIENDHVQWTHNDQRFVATAGLIAWSGPSGSVTPLILPANSETVMNFSFSQRNKYGCLVVPATATSQGYIKNFINGVQVFYAAGAPQVVWNQYNPAAAPPNVAGTSAGSLIDVSHLALIAGTDITCPMTLYGCSVWQGAGAANTTGPTPTITALAPGVMPHGSATFTLAVNGTNFTRLATVYWGATALTTTYGSANQLFATVPDTLVVSAGTANVTVQNTAFSISNGATFTIS